ncbi:hypothetical protein PUN28_017544 [Cardiocondyla obscurior]|uniref:Sequestosome-1 n=1 Tax=Cardiocondyla obscurior TaxID=286306 RepID=A0AAW2ELT7_9HYME
MGKLSFKVYLTSEDPWIQGPTEVRRFGIDADVAKNFNYLREKLQSIFPQLRNKNFIVTWKDIENESITISTNEELELALEEMESHKIGMIKLYVTLLMEQKEGIDMPKIEKILHPGVVCDVCEKDIHGFRFKCMQCRDYDLCTECMTLGNHSQHYMVRMTQPIEWSSYHGRRLAHHMHKFLKKTAAHCKDDERRYFHKSKRNDCPLFNVDDESNEQKRTPKEQHKEPSAEAATEATEDPQQEATRRSFSQLLKLVEDNISNFSQFLDPLGINVTVLADDDSPNQKQASSAQTKTNAQKPEAGPSTSENTGKKFPGEGKKLRDDPIGTANTSLSTDNASTQKEATKGATGGAEQAAEAEEWTMIQRESVNNSCTSSASSSSDEVIKESTPSAPVPEKTPSNQQIYPSLPQEVRHEFHHPDPKIQQAVEAMIAMGFSNEGQWLTHLLVAQNGNIDKALDVIYPVRRH